MFCSPTQTAGHRGEQLRDYESFDVPGRMEQSEELRKASKERSVTKVLAKRLSPSDSSQVRQ